jgi:hypothetical protein
MFELDARLERNRHQSLAADVDRLTEPNIGSGVAVLAQTTTVSSYPTTAAAFYAANPLEIDAVESEGATASFVADPTQVLYLLNVGSAVPPQGTTVIAHAIGGRWVFRFDG